MPAAHGNSGTRWNKPGRNAPREAGPRSKGALRDTQERVMKEAATDTPVLVSIGIPTYDRADMLRRAILSALAQDYRNIELVISDNASSDGTEAVCREFAAADRRIKYIRQPRNLGPTPNFVAVLEQATGDYFMWLCDDDWLDTNYVSACLEELVQDAGVIVVGGISKYYHGEEYQGAGKVMNLAQDDNVDRMLTYYSTVEDNGIYFGLWRRVDIARLPCVNTMGNDWLALAAAAYVGRVRTIETTTMHRDLGGSTVSFAAIADQMRLPGYERYFPYLSIAVNATYDVLLRAWPFNELPLPTRIYVAFRVFYKLVTRYVIRTTVISVFIKLRSMVFRSRSRSSPPPV